MDSIRAERARVADLYSEGIMQKEEYEDKIAILKLREKRFKRKQRKRVKNKPFDRLVSSEYTGGSTTGGKSHSADGGEMYLKRNNPYAVLDETTAGYASVPKPSDDMVKIRDMQKVNRHIIRSVIGPNGSGFSAIRISSHVDTLHLEGDYLVIEGYTPRVNHAKKLIFEQLKGKSSEVVNIPGNLKRLPCVVNSIKKKSIEATYSVELRLNRNAGAIIIVGPTNKVPSVARLIQTHFQKFKERPPINFVELKAPKKRVDELLRSEKYSQTTCGIRFYPDLTVIASEGVYNELKKDIENIGLEYFRDFLSIPDAQFAPGILGPNASNISKIKASCGVRTILVLKDTLRIELVGTKENVAKAKEIFEKMVSEMGIFEYTIPENIKKDFIKSLVKERGKEIKRIQSETNTTLKLADDLLLIIGERQPRNRARKHIVKLAKRLTSDLS